MNLHGAKFHKNAMAKKPAGAPKIAGAAPQEAPRTVKVPPVVHPTPKPSQLQGARLVSKAARVTAD